MMIFMGTGSLLANCNWKARNGNLYTKDSCWSTVYFIETGISFNGMFSGKYKCEWKLNNVKVGDSGPVQMLTVTQNGIYSVCVKAIDTINNCDTVYCKTIVVDCISTCSWSSKNAQYATYDSCYGVNNRKSVNAYIWFPNAGCYKYQWYINNIVVNGSQASLTHTVTKNGTYSICVKVTDTCNNCDTVFCRNVNVTCFPGCNWKSRNPQYNVWDSCSSTNKSLNARISFQKDSCYTYEWTINNATVAGTSNKLSHPITKNGFYTVCVKVKDTCNSCDTTYCLSRIINCAGICNWKSRNGNLYTKDSCRGDVNFIEAGVSFNGMFSGKYKCYWSLNGESIGTRSSVQKFSVYINRNYIVCVKVVDTVNNCDTSYCTHVEVDCIDGCLWKQRNLKLEIYDSCKGYNNRSSFNAYLVGNFSGCSKYEWKVNGVVQNLNSPYLSYTIQKDTTYQVCVKITDTCQNCDTVYCYNYVTNCFGNNIQTISDNGIQIYPNPNSGVFQIESTESAVVSVYDMQGKHIRTFTLEAGIHNVDLSFLEKGCYLLQMNIGKQTLQNKILVIE